MGGLRDKDSEREDGGRGGEYRRTEGALPCQGSIMDEDALLIEQ
jgi:hypothetical protein